MHEIPDNSIGKKYFPAKEKIQRKSSTLIYDLGVKKLFTLAEGATLETKGQKGHTQTKKDE